MEELKTVQLFQDKGQYKVSEEDLRLAKRATSRLHY
jgi:hypothetical protein